MNSYWVTDMYKRLKKGDKFSSWEVIGDDNPKNVKILCRCVCGKEKEVSKSSLKKGTSTACQSCSAKKRDRTVDYGIHPGDKIGYWTLLEQQGKLFLCRCVCGKERKVNASFLLDGTSMSCGCKRSERFSAGQINGKKLGNKIIEELHAAGLNPRYNNTGLNKNSTSGIPGVSQMKNGRYRAYIMVDRKQISLGFYDKIEDAAAARKAGEEKYFAPRAKQVREIIEKEKKAMTENKSDTVMRERVCRQCGKKFIGGPRAWYCPECRADRHREQKARYAQNLRAGKSIIIGKTVRKCERCGAEFVMMSARQRYCTECRDDAIREADRRQGIEHYEKNKGVKNPIRNENRKEKRKKDVFCIVCGKPLADHIGKRNTCSDECRKIRDGYRVAQADMKRGKRKSLPSWEEWKMDKYGK